MRPVMKRLAPLLLLGLSACDLIPNILGTAAETATQAAADAAGIKVSPEGAPAANTTSNSPGVQSKAINTNSTETTTPPTAEGGVKTVTIDKTKKLEYVDVWVDMLDPNGQRALVPYLLKNDEWMLIKCEMTGPTSKHYTFQRVTTSDGRSLPQVDLFNKQGR